MSLSEVEAVFFLPFVVLVYWLLPARASWQNVWLLAASYVFCASWHSTALLLLLFGTLLDWLVGIGLAGKRARQTLLAISLIANVGTLAWFKYAGLFTGTSWLLPIG
ncbi:MAG TPA: MBOAT family protein, partial [Planctomycetota bacterium]|nr:MBOAT family protein [Planctomycetota bacterium]